MDKIPEDTELKLNLVLGCKETENKRYISFMWLLDILVTLNVDNDCINFPSFLLKLRQKEIFVRIFVHLFSFTHKHWFRELYLLKYSGFDVEMLAVVHTLPVNAEVCRMRYLGKGSSCAYALDTNFSENETEILFLKCKLWNRLNHKFTSYLKHNKLIYRKWKLGEIMEKDNS